MIHLLLAVAVQTGTDTLGLTLDEALARATSESPMISAARNRLSASEALRRQARAWGNPFLQLAAENLGAQKAVTGTSGWGGTEGQVLLRTELPLGGDRSSRIFRADAQAREAEAMALLTEADVRLGLLETAARAELDRTLAKHALEEAQGLEALALALRQQAERGRISEGESSRAVLAAVSGWTAHGRAVAQAAESASQLSLFLGTDPATPTSVGLPMCSSSWIPDDGTPPESALYGARIDVALGREREMKAAAIPNVAPQAGLRRSAGVSGLFLGLEIPLPLFDRNRAAREAAGLQVMASRNEAQAAIREIDARRESVLQALAAAEASGEHFTPAWRAALDRTVEAAEARFRLGEGTLTELLDSRRARLQALGDFERWKMERLVWRGRAARASGTLISEATLCPTAVPTAQEAQLDSDHVPEEVR